MEFEAHVSIIFGSLVISFISIISKLLDSWNDITPKAYETESKITYYKMPTIIENFHKYLIPTGYLNQRQLEELMIYYNVDIKNIGMLEMLSQIIESVKRRLLICLASIGIILILIGLLRQTVSMSSFEINSLLREVIFGSLMTTLIIFASLELYLLAVLLSNKRQADRKIKILSEIVKQEVEKRLNRGKVYEKRG